MEFLKEVVTKAVDDIIEIAPKPAFIASIVVTLAVGYLAGSFIARRFAFPGRRRARFKATPGMVEIYVGNLSYETEESILRKEFEKFGEVKSARIITNHFTNKSKGFGFVEMPNREEAEKAIKALDDAEINGRKLRVNEARNKIVS